MEGFRLSQTSVIRRRRSGRLVCGVGLPLSFRKSNGLGSGDRGGHSSPAPYPIQYWRRRHSQNLPDATTYKGLSDSQRNLLEVMRDYKAGQMTLREMEEHFRLWQRKHNGPSILPGDNDTEETCPDPGDFSWMWRRPSRKTSNTSDWTKRFSGSSSQRSSAFLSSLETYRKSSNASASSSSSKTSEASALTMQSQLHSGSNKSSHEICPGWMSSPSVCPLNQETNPPPLPIRRRPWSRSKIDPDEYLKSKSIARRIQGTHLPLELNELQSKNQEIDYKDFHDTDTLESLFEVCEKYGLTHLGDLFFREYYPESDAQKNPKPMNEKGLRVNVMKNMAINQSCLQLPSVKWADCEDSGNSKRPLSLPSILYTTDDLLDNNIEKGEECTLNQNTVPGFGVNRCEEYVNSIQSNLYASIQAYISMNSQKEALQRNGLSKSQQELLELMNEFKRGEKTISQVEHQFNEWHRRHMDTASKRDEELSQLKDQYEKAQKSSYFGLKHFILGKQKKKSAKTSTCSKPGKRNKKSETEMKRLSKVSQTSTSSNVSDCSDVFKTVGYFNPAYGETTQEMPRKKYSNCSSTKICPPPLPPRPALTPASILKCNSTKDDHCCNLEAEKNLQTSRYSPKSSAEKKPSPPPKPANLYQKVCDNESGCCQEEEPYLRPESPVYIIPNKILKVHSKKNLTKMGQSSEAHLPLVCPVSIAHTCAKANFKPVFSNTSPGTSTSQTPKKKSDDVSAKRQVQLFPSPWMKSKKTEESRFYIARRCSSSPNLSGDLPAPQPIYLDLQELFGKRIKSIRKSNTPKN